MGLDNKLEKFCDDCFKRSDFYHVCSLCEVKLRCELCTQKHFRKKHPSIWMEIMIPKLKEAKNNAL